MIKGATSSGFEYEVNEKVLSDWTFVKAVAASGSKDNTRQMEGYTKLVNLLLGDEAEERLCEHLRQEDGLVPVEKISGEVLEIMQAIGEEAKK